MPLVAKRYLRRPSDPVQVESKEEEEDRGDNVANESAHIEESVDHAATIDTTEALLEDDDDDEDAEAVQMAQKKAGRRKFTDAEAIAWVEEQLHDMRLQEEEEAIQAEYAELQRHMAELEISHQEALKEPDQEERQIQMMMSTVDKEQDAEMQTHKDKSRQKLEKVKKSKRKSEKGDV